MDKMVKEIEVENVQQLRDALAEFPADMSVGDVFGEMAILRLFEDTETGDQYLTIE